MPGFSWMLNLVYAALLAAVSPLLVYRMLARGKYHDGWGQKLLGRLPLRNATGPCLWFHAVSVGEVLQLQTVLGTLAAKRPECEFVVTTTTQTGYAVARNKFPQHRVCYFPLDFSWSVRRAMRRIRPSAIVLVELELWPNFIFEAERAEIPIALINGRVSEHSFRGYRLILPLMKHLWPCFRLIAVQNETYKQRLIELGAAKERISVTGTIKFDHVQTDRQNRQTLELRRSFGLGDGQRVFVAGSTQAPEEDFAIHTYLELRSEFPDLRLILVPRHKERFDEVAQLVHRRRLPLLRRSQLLCRTATQRENGDVPVLLLDTLGELAACWGLADIAFVGGSLTNRGGQNMIEPAAYGAAVLFGPNTHNFRDVVEALLSRGAAHVVVDRDDLTRAVRSFLEHPQTAREQGWIAQQFVVTQQGATEKTVQLLQQLFNGCNGSRIHSTHRSE